MFETLISSKIRRALFEYILTKPAHRFYLRGLAKELGLAISPLRRELKRLEGLGVLKAYQEANVLFYVVDQSSPHFAELKAVLSGAAPAPASAQGLPGPVPAEAPGEPEPAEVLASLPSAQDTPEHGEVAVAEEAPAATEAAVATHVPEEIPVVSTVLSHAKIERIRRASTPKFLVWGRALTPSIHWPLVIGGACGCVFVALMLGWAIAYYRSVTTQLSATNQQLQALTHKTGVAPPAPVGAVESGEAEPPVPVAESAPALPPAQPAQWFVHAPAQEAASPVTVPSVQAGEMKSSRWRLVPGTMGGFSAGASGEVH